MLPLHTTIANAVVMYFGLLALWGLFLGVRGAPVSPGFRAALYLGGGVAVLQALVGVALLAMGGRSRDDLHFLYGLSLIVALPLAHQFLVVPGRLRAPLAYGLACAFMVGLALRGITTGR